MGFGAISKVSEAIWGGLGDAEADFQVTWSDFTVTFEVILGVVFGGFWGHFWGCQRQILELFWVISKFFKAILE